jgi:hypothetical protein
MQSHRLHGRVDEAELAVEAERRVVLQVRQERDAQDTFGALPPSAVLTV